VGQFTFTETELEGVFIIEPRVFGDERGYFMETYNKADFYKAGITCEFVQDNQSKSNKGVLRGLHFQKQYPQAKLVRVTKGEVYDVAVDLRKDSPTYGKHVGVILSAEKKNMFFIPKGFAHGFLVLSEEAEFTYKCDEFYHPEDEGGIRYDDPNIGIEWPMSNSIIFTNDKDGAFRYLKV
jgi:dTDP-4-dehydrorhamnose 3,5-epimerase